MGRGSVRGGEKGDAIFRTALISLLLLFGSFLTSQTIRCLVRLRARGLLMPLNAPLPLRAVLMSNVSVYLITDDLSDISYKVNLPVNDQFRR